jgi:hypothetical protein
METFPCFGSITHATMRTQDIFPDFTACLEYLDKKGKYAYLIKQCKKIIRYRQWENENTQYILNEELFDALNSFAPEGFYFGSHPGDGSDYGFWESEEI